MFDFHAKMATFSVQDHSSFLKTPENSLYVFFNKTSSFLYFCFLPIKYGACI